MKEEEQESLEAAPRALGLARWVQFAFLLTGLLAFWLFDKVIYASWNLLAESFHTLPEPEGRYITPASLLFAVGVIVMLFRHQGINRFSHEVASEMTRVNWPDRQETMKQTGVVLIVSILASLILGLFDIIWANVTDLIY